MADDQDQERNHENDNQENSEFEDCYQCKLQRLDDCDWTGNPRRPCKHCLEGGHECGSVSELMSLARWRTGNTQQPAPQRTMGTNDFNGQGSNPQMPQVVYHGPTFTQGWQPQAQQPRRPKKPQRNGPAQPDPNNHPIAQTPDDLSENQKRDIKKIAWDVINKNPKANPTKIRNVRAESGKLKFMNEYILEVRQRDGTSGRSLPPAAHPNPRQGPQTNTGRPHGSSSGQGAHSQLRDTVTRNEQSNVVSDLQREVESWKYKSRTHEFDKQAREKELQEKLDKREKELRELQRALSNKNLELGQRKKSQRNKGNGSYGNRAKRRKVDDDTRRRPSENDRRFIRDNLIDRSDDDESGDEDVGDIKNAIEDEGRDFAQGEDYPSRQQSSAWSAQTQKRKAEAAELPQCSRNARIKREEITQPIDRPKAAPREAKEQVSGFDEDFAKALLMGREVFKPSNSQEQAGHVSAQPSPYIKREPLDDDEADEDEHNHPHRSPSSDKDQEQ